MPRRDGKGPMGRGPMSGKGLGVCNRANANANANTNADRTGTGFGRRSGSGRGLGLGMGHGCRRGFGRNFSEETDDQADRGVLK